MKNITHTRIGYAAIMLAMAFFTACQQSDKQKTLGNSQDTTSVTRAGGPPIRDTATVNKDKQDSSNTGQSKQSPTNTGQSNQSSTSKGNADPSGHMKKQ